MIHDFFVLSPRGDTILAKQYRAKSNVGAHERSHTEAFFRKVKFWDDMALTPGGGGDNPPPTLTIGPEGGKEGGGTDKKGDAPPVFMMPDGLSYLHVKRGGLIFGCSTARNVSPNTVIELLSKISKVFKDYCGTLSEESIRKNFILLYELLDEMVDYGYPQVTQTENLKAFVYNEPIVVAHVANTGNMINPKTASASAVHKPVIASVNANGKKNTLTQNQKNEIFVDILERLNIVFSNTGYVMNSSIDGCIQMKSYLAGSPELRLALNEDLVIGKQQNQYGSVVVDDINFNDCVNLTEFESARTLSFLPPDGEFVVLNYRMTGEYRAPFKIFPSIEETGPKTFEISVLIRAEIPDNHFGANVTVEIPLPKATTAASCTIGNNRPGQASAEYMSQDRKILWQIKKFPGMSEQNMRAKVTLTSACTTKIRKEIGPIVLNFEIPMFNVSNLQVRYLRIAEAIPGYTPYRWVRYVTQSSSYVCRM
mmetsp:Transcript_12624/g.15907  ORF Transcript_12624/g.15907 Transcript_12624/m.15907 type:complete len:481 (-) Transcript_12624:153-1595(-)|eukprot:CAMPEP_0172487438 /NCGR_PEP_ID=MMETSP1066-20121228/16544_1 /TAXON_ID=671091 /ORGANISM="Coscinodiscus wailesii, Strain CCMP2513" /LENGTH=480 /DNA_ID=CAMNT_0013254059 /DNA_START=129 /DNA_END=1571 /DNA_ORIENTATION=-